ncbi:MAG: PAS domain S-box protein [Desulfobacteraceae bacterium]
MPSKGLSLSKMVETGSPFSTSMQTFSPLCVGVVGGGEACYELLKNIQDGHLDKFNLKVAGVAGQNDQAPGYRYAQELGLFTTARYQDLYSLPGLNTIIELTGSEAVMEDLLRTKPRGVSLLDHRVARVLWIPLLQKAGEGDLETLLAYHKNMRKNTQRVLDSLPYKLMVVNKDKTINMVNQTFLKAAGLTQEEVLGEYCHKVRYGLDKPCGEYGRPCYLDVVKENREIVSTIHEIDREDGEKRFEVITVSPMFDLNGELTQILETSRDVTDRLKLEREVQTSKTFFENVIESTVDGIVVVDTKGNVLIFNQGMEKLTGYSSSEIIDRGHLSSFYDIDVAKENMKKMRSDQYGPIGKLNPTRMSITTKTGEEIPVTLSASIIEVNGKEIGSVGVFTDMREVLQMRKDLEAAHLQLVQSEKIASVGRMAAGVAHEINNPLSGVLIYAELLAESFKEDPDTLRDIQEIIDQTLRCKRIVSELLEFSRQTVGKVSSFHISDLVTKCLNVLVNQSAFQDIEVSTDFQPHMPQMVGDMGQLQQVFANLFINAADAMEGKGRLGITARYDDEKGQFTIRVADTGPGIPENLRDKIFDIFFTTKPVGKGTGLGLSITENIIKLHGGRVKIDCPAEGGTVFMIELPLGFVEQTRDEPLFIGLDE